MNWRFICEKYANILAERINDTKVFSKAEVYRMCNSFSVRYKICDFTYEYPVTIENARRGMDYMQEDFDKFVANCIIHASQARTMQLMQGE